jgi:cyclase
MVICEMTMFTRRKVVKGLCQSSLLAMVPGSVRLLAQTAALKTTQLNENISVVQGPNANVLVVNSSDGVIVVDSGDAAWSAELLALIDKLPGAPPVRALINTHWHPEQTGSNLALGERGAEIIAHDNTKQWLSVDVQQRWSGMTYKALPAAARPQSVIYDTTEKVIGEHTLQLGYLLHAHTDGDLYVYLPAENMLFAGGFLTNDTWPIVDWWTGGWSGGMLNAFELVVPLCNDQTVIVPSSGPLMTFAQLQAQQEMYLAILGKVHTAFVQSLGPEETAASKPAAGYKPEWGSADLFIKLAAQSLHGHLRSGVGNWLPRIP